jgi:outer membrane protein assembly factor BamB
VRTVIVVMGLAISLGALLCAGCVEAQKTEAANAAAAPALPKSNRPGIDWPRFLGPNQDNISPEKGILTTWPRTGLRKVWECELGIGYPPPSIADGRLFEFGRFEDRCRLTARNAETGEVLWKHEYNTDYEDRYGYDPGPRAAPVVDGDRVYGYGPEGMLFCLKVDSGQVLWKLDTREKFFFFQNFFGVGSSPVVDGDMLIITVGGSPKGRRPVDFRDAKPDGTAIVGLDKKTGEIKYAAMDELSSYASPLVTTIGGKKFGLYFARGGLLGFDPATGTKTFHYPWRAKIMESVNASNPIVVGDKILLTECYGVGSSLLELKDGKVKEVWSDAEKEAFDKSLMCHWNTPVHVDGYVYGSSGRHTPDADIRCIELATGDLMWREKRTTRCSLLYVDGHFLSLSEAGELRLFKPNPKKYEEVAKWEVDDLKYPCWAPPVLSRGLLYVRGQGKLLCLELIPAK